MRVGFHWLARNSFADRIAFKVTPTVNGLGNCFGTRFPKIRVSANKEKTKELQKPCVFIDGEVAQLVRATAS